MIVIVYFGFKFGICGLTIALDGGGSVHSPLLLRHYFLRFFPVIRMLG